jgi:hypothetical protein
MPAMMRGEGARRVAALVSSTLLLGACLLLLSTDRTGYEQTVPAGLKDELTDGIVAPKHAAPPV